MLALCDGGDGDTIGSGGHFRGVLQKNSDGELLSQKIHGLLQVYLTMVVGCRIALLTIFDRGQVLLSHIGKPGSRLDPLGSRVAG